jgi:hypothetical protein
LTEGAYSHTQEKTLLRGAGFEETAIMFSLKIAWLLIFVRLLECSPLEHVRSAHAPCKMTSGADDGGCSENEASSRSYVQTGTTPGPSVVNYLVAPEFRTIRCIFLLAFFSNFSYYCSELPLLRIVERAICEVYYDKKNSGHALATEIDEKMCKIPKIQNDLALFMGYKTAFDAIPRTHLPSEKLE